MAEEKKENAGQTDHQYKEVPTKTMDQRHRMYLTSCLYLVGFLDLFGVSMLIPLMSRHARDLGASPMWIGAVGSVYGILQLISGPFVGRLSDVLGRRPVLLVCLFMCAVGYTINIFASSVLVLILSRIPLGIFKHGIATVKAYLAEITPKDERPHVFGRYGAISSTGFIVGPLFGGYLAEYEGGFYKVATCTAAIFVVNFVFVYILVHPQKNPPLEKTKSVSSFTKEEYSIQTKPGFLKSFKDVVKSSGDLLFLQLIMGFAIMMYRSNFTLIMEERFHTTPKINGWLISFGAFVAVVAGMLVGRIISFYSSIAKLLLHCSALLCFILFGLTFAPSLFVVVVLTGLLSVVNPISRVCITDLSINRGNKDKTGALLGMSQSFMSVARSFSPLVSGIMLEYGQNAPGLTGVFCAMMGTCLLIAIPPGRTITQEKKKD
ncbi:major facilitator superfamily domain-containing protein 9-like isoform X2 [Asterias rubens]|uniref:major facilitator superfamily domain-containing protein 9-like isoform X2 n=2 Tax=Asterias rubens TaxID=7604 RepID=UPI001455BCA5|nr:major facilitator superfamily domain-containing protein 9-like isoform X2 [Asterias rubens]